MAAWSFLCVRGRASDCLCCWGGKKGGSSREEVSVESRRIQSRYDSLFEDDVCRFNNIACGWKIKKTSHQAEDKTPSR